MMLTKCYCTEKSPSAMVALMLERLDTIPITYSRIGMLHVDG
jgi:hypothetical protein